MAASSKATVVLKAVKSITIRFSPFAPNVRATREFLTKVASEKARSTNMNCEVQAIIKHDNSEPTVDIMYADGERLLMKGANLTSSEMLSAFQSRCIAKDPQGKAAVKK